MASRHDSPGRLAPGARTGYEDAVRLASSTALLALLAACGGHRSEADIRADFASYLGGRRACDGDAACVLVSPGCPLGCSVAVNRAHADEVEAYGRALVREYERRGQRCDYDCAPTAARCEGGSCTVVPQ